MAHVLVVDDRAVNRDLLVTLLGYSGHSMSEAADGAEALDIVQRDHPDLVITDIRMPVMDGAELVRSIRADPAIAGTPVIFYTATYREREARAIALSCGVQDVIGKPASPSDILQTVARALGTISTAAPEPLAARHQKMQPNETAVQAVELHVAMLRSAAIIEAGLEFTAEPDPDKLLDKACRAVQDVVRARYVAIGILDEGGAGLERLVTAGYSSETVERMRAFPPAKVLERLLTTRQPHRLVDVPEEVLAALLPAGHPPVREFLGISVASLNQTYGWLYVCDKVGGEHFDKEDERLIETLAAQLAQAYENALLHRRLKVQAKALRQEIEQRRQVEEQFRLLAEHAQDVIYRYRLSPSPGFEYVSPSATIITGYAPEQHYADPHLWIKLVHSDDREAFQQALVSPVAGVLVTHWVLKDGRSTWAELRYVPVYGESGRLIAVEGVARDITERKRLDDERAARAAAEAAATTVRHLEAVNQAAWAHLGLDELLSDLLRLIRDTMGADMVISLILEPDGKVFMARAAVGLDEEERRRLRIPIEKSFAGQVAAQRRPIIMDDLQEAFTVVDPLLRGKGLRSLLGAPLVVEGRILGVLDVGSFQPQHFTEGDMHFLQAVADRTALAIEHARLFEALSAGANQQRAVADLGLYALAESDLQTLFEHCAAVVIATLETQTSSIMELLPGGDQLLLREGIGFPTDGRLVKGQTTIPARSDSQAGYTLLSGAPLVVEDARQETRFTIAKYIQEKVGIVSGMSCVITGPGGKPWGVLATHSTKKRHFGEDDVNFLQAIANMLGSAIQRTQTEDALREEDRRKDEFLATLSHELRNPLAALRSGVDLLNLAQNEPAAIEGIPQILDHSVGHLTRLVNDLLDISRLQRGRISLQKQPLDVRLFIGRALENARPLIAERRQELTVCLQQEPMHVDGDLTRLVQVLTNLLDNATKYTPEGGRISLTAKSTDTIVTLRVQDTGLGMSPDFLPYAFELFTREAHTGDITTSGLGLGLPTVKSLVEMHGGTVRGESLGPGQGSTFTVTLPRLTTPSLEEILPLQSPRSSHVAGGLRVLLVEDNDNAAQTMTLLLEHLGHKVERAPNGESALGLAEEYLPHIIFVDIGLPGMDGYEVARRLRKSEATQDIALIALTGFGMEKDRKKAQETGFDRHLTKPVDLTTLQDVLHASALSK